MNVVLTNEDGEVVAYISDTGESMIMGGYNLVNYGNTEPVFEADELGHIYLKENTWILDLAE